MRFAANEVGPDENHRGAGCRRQQDESGDIGLNLVGREHRREYMADQQRPEQRHREGFDRPVDEECHANPAGMLCDFPHGGEVDLQEHRDDHQPDQNCDRQVDLRDFRA